MLVKTEFEGAPVEIDLPEDLNVDLLDAEDVGESDMGDEKADSHIDLSDPIFGADHNKMLYYNDGIHSLVHRSEMLDKLKEATDFTHLAHEMSDLTRDGGLKKQVLRKGDEAGPNDGVQVWIHAIWFAEGIGEPYDSTRERGRMDTFKLNGQTLPCLDIAVRSMKFNEVSIFISTPRYAFGPLGCPPRIPAGARILFMIELLDMDSSREQPLFMKTKAERQKLGFDHILSEAERLRRVSTEKVKAGDFDGAQKSCQIALEILEDYDASTASELAWKSQSTYNTLTRLAENLLANFDFEPIGDLVKKARAMKILVRDTTLLLIYAKALIGLGEPANAKAALEEAMEIEPNDSEVLRVFNEVTCKEQENDEADKMTEMINDDPVPLSTEEDTSSPKKSEDATSEQRGFFSKISSLSTFLGSHFGRM